MQALLQRAESDHVSIPAEMAWMLIRIAEVVASNTDGRVRKFKPEHFRSLHVPDFLRVALDAAQVEWEGQIGWHRSGWLREAPMGRRGPEVGEVYGCIDDAGNLRYVGSTMCGIQARVNSHIYDAVGKPFQRWLRWLVASGRKAAFVQLAECKGESETRETESKMIRECFAAGVPLLNVASPHTHRRTRMEAA
jgi:hypothetical protein